jgi:signal transduction histidine kinase
MALPGKIRHGLFWTVREALNNTVKHAHADMVRIVVRVNASSLCVTVEDDGCGFDPAVTGPDGTHEGLDNMRRRMREIGGRIELSSRPGGGTRLELSVTLEEQAGPSARSEEAKTHATAKGGGAA